MKKAAILLVSIVTLSSCSLFQKPGMSQEEVDALIQQKAAVEEELANLQQDYALLKLKADECSEMLNNEATEQKASGKFLVIAGSFKNRNNADSYAAKVKNAGGEGQIIAGPAGYSFVVFSGHPTLREASKSMYDVRITLSDDAWIYQER